VLEIFIEMAPGKEGEEREGEKDRKEDIVCRGVVYLRLTAIFPGGPMMCAVRCRDAPCGLRGCKNRPAPFPGQMSYKATKPGSVCPVC